MINPIKNKDLVAKKIQREDQSTCYGTLRNGFRSELFRFP